MLGRLSVALSVVAALGLAVAVSAPADAKEVKKVVRVNKTVHVNRTVNVNRNVRVNRNVNVNRNVGARGNFVVGRTYNGRVWYGHNRHFWHGSWYAYGTGPCWVDVEGEWFWNPIACP